MCDPILLVSASHGSGVDESAGDYVLFQKALSDIYVHMLCHEQQRALSVFCAGRVSALRAIVLMVQCQVCS